MPAAAEEQTIHVTTWGSSGPVLDAAVAGVLSASAREWHRAQRRQEAADALGGRVASALIAGTIADEAVLLLVDGPPPAPLGWRQRLRLAWRVLKEGVAHG